MRRRAVAVLSLLKAHQQSAKLCCLKVTKHGFPHHPLYVLATQLPAAYPPNSVASDVTGDVALVRRTHVDTPDTPPSGTDTGTGTDTGNGTGLVPVQGCTGA